MYLFYSFGGSKAWLRLPGGWWWIQLWEDMQEGEITQ
jgi:hypothetical protein